MCKLTPVRIREHVDAIMIPPEFEPVKTRIMGPKVRYNSLVNARVVNISHRVCDYHKPGLSWYHYNFNGFCLTT